MFSLIITVVSIALVVALIVATQYHIGDVHTEATNTVSAAQRMQEGEQLFGAFVRYNADHGTTPSGSVENVQSLLVAGGYLASWPDVNWSVESGRIVVTENIDENVCLALNKGLGIDHIPSCSDAAFDGLRVCCSD